jgi:hypothetical protein
VAAIGERFGKMEQINQPAAGELRAGTEPGRQWSGKAAGGIQKELRKV